MASIVLQHVCNMSRPVIETMCFHHTWELPLLSMPVLSASMMPWPRSAVMPRPFTTPAMPKAPPRLKAAGLEAQQTCSYKAQALLCSQGVRSWRPSAPCSQS